MIVFGLVADTSQEVVEQNREIARTQHEVAEGSKRLVEAVAESRHEHNELQRDLQKQGDKLDSERRAMATQRRRESLIVPVLETTGVLIVAALPLVLAWYLLHGIRSPDEDVSDVLVQELVSDQPRLLSPPWLRSNEYLAAIERCTLLLVEGINDIEFLRRISRILHRSDRSFPDVAELERKGQLVMLPFGGGNVSAWTDRLAPLGCPELHLYDREAGGESRCRLEAAKRVNARANCRAFVMRKRSLENYLHPRALKQSVGVDLHFGDHDPVAELVAACRFIAEEPSLDWQCLSRRAQKRLSNSAKRWLNTRAVEEMTPELLIERDPQGEVVSWLQTVAAMTA